MSQPSHGGENVTKGKIKFFNETKGFLHLAPQISQIVKTGAPILAAIEQVEPAILPLLENLAKQVFPQVDQATAKTVIAKGAFAPQSWTPQEQQIWWDRAADAE
jgi:cold shock CspA family protein